MVELIEVIHEQLPLAAAGPIPLQDLYVIGPYLVGFPCLVIFSFVLS